MSCIRIQNRLLAAVGVFGLFTYPVMAQAAPASNPPSVAQFLGDYFGAMDRALLPGGAALDDLMRFYADGDSAPESVTLARYEQRKVAAFHRWVGNKGDVYRSIATTPTIGSISTAPSGQQVTVEVATATTMLWSAPSGSPAPRFTPEKAQVMATAKRDAGAVFRPQDTITSIVSTQHVMRLIQEQGSWKVQTDRYRDPFDQRLAADHVTPTDEADGTATATTGSAVLPASTCSGCVETYDRSRAVSYADTYALNRNPLYVDYSRKGGDCANFVSQTLGDAAQGAGLAFESSWYYTYPSGRGKSRTRTGGSANWINAGGLHNFVTANPSGAAYNFSSLGAVGTWSGTTSFDRSTMVPGDLHFYDWDNNGVIDHTAIAVALLSDGTTLVDAHTNDRYHVRYDFGTQSDTTTRYYMDHMNATITVP